MPNLVKNFMKGLTFVLQTALKRSGADCHLRCYVIARRFAFWEALHDELFHPQGILGSAQLADALLGYLIVDCSHLGIGGDKDASGIGLGKRHGHMR